VLKRKWQIALGISVLCGIFACADGLAPNGIHPRGLLYELKPRTDTTTVVLPATGTAAIATNPGPSYSAETLVKLTFSGTINLEFEDDPASPERLA
jgi:hypothetical protein